MFEFLDKDAKKLLKGIKKLNSQGILYPELYDLVKVTNLSKDDIQTTAYYLSDRDYISAQIGNGELCMFELLHKGHKYKEFQWIAIKVFLMKSVIVPIVVSFITSIISILLFK